MKTEDAVRLPRKIHYNFCNDYHLMGDNLKIVTVNNSKKFN